MTPRSLFAPSAIALTVLTAFAGCGDDARAAAPERATQSAVVPAATDTPAAPSDSLRAPSVRTELAATNPGAARTVGEVRGSHASGSGSVRAESTRDSVRGENASGGVGGVDDANGSVRVSRLLLATDVVDRAPVGAATTFRATDTERLYAFLEVRNDAPSDAELVVVFRRTDSTDRDERGGVQLSVPAAQRRWRTWSFTRHAKAPGSWEAIVRTADGAELARTPFVVE